MNRRFSISRRTIVLGLSLVTGLTAWLAVRGAESPESREIKARLKKQVDRIASLEVSYRREETSPLKPEQILAMAECRNKLFLSKDEWHEAFKGRKRYDRQVFPEKVTLLRRPDEFGMTPVAPVDPKAPPLVQKQQKELRQEYDRMVAAMKAQKARGGPPRYVFDNQPERDITRAFNGRTLWRRSAPSDKATAYQVWPPTSECDWFQVKPYAMATGLHVPDPTGRFIVRRAQAMFRVADWASDSAYQLEDRSEVIDGSTCVILNGSLNSLLQPGMIVGDLTNRIWLDRDHGLAIRKREIARNGRVAMRWINTDLREVEPGLWLPMHCRQESYAEDAPPDYRDKPVLIEELRVTKLEINKVSDDLFDMTPRKSDRVEDLRGVLRGK
jgi:hypothetical protein